MSNDTARLIENMQKATAMWPEIVQALAECAQRAQADGKPELNSHVSQAFVQYFQHKLQADPLSVAQAQWNWWQESSSLWQKQLSHFMQIPGEKSPPEPRKDRRFRGEAWQQSWLFDSMKEQYLLAAEAIANDVANIDDELEPHTAHMVQFYTQQWVDALSPANYPWSNPEVMQRTIESDGESLISGLNNLRNDLAKGEISMTSPDAFELGKNIATTPAKVMFENELFQLLQYAPATEQVFEIPLLVIPAWINKYYILDLQPENSMLKWLTEQGFTVFVISWVNPDSQHRDIGFEDYMLRGAWEAIKHVQLATGQSAIHVAGYCLGGTLLSCLLSWLASKGKQDAIRSATLLTTMVDFADAGDLKVFIDEPQIAATEERMARNGYLEGSEMALTFNMLRPSDLIWSFVIQNYLLGKEPLAFDLLYWNADSTRMPAAMHSFYLREMYLNNRLATPGGLQLGDEAIDLTTITIPSYLLAAKDDHIAPWHAAYLTSQHYRGDVTFTLAASGHIAGVVNPPSKQKYHYWTNDALPTQADDWLDGAQKHEGSWWPHWLEWARPLSGDMVAARTPGDGPLRIIEAGPGRYASKRTS